MKKTCAPPPPLPYNPTHNGVGDVAYPPPQATYQQSYPPQATNNPESFCYTPRFQHPVSSYPWSLYQHDPELYSPAPIIHAPAPYLPHNSGDNRLPYPFVPDLTAYPPAASGMKPAGPPYPVPGGTYELKMPELFKPASPPPCVPTADTNSAHYSFEPREQITAKEMDEIKQHTIKVFDRHARSFQNAEYWIIFRNKVIDR